MRRHAARLDRVGRRNCLAPPAPRSALTTVRAARAPSARGCQQPFSAATRRLGGPPLARARPRDAGRHRLDDGPRHRGRATARYPARDHPLRPLGCAARARPRAVGVALRDLKIEQRCSASRTRRSSRCSRRAAAPSRRRPSPRRRQTRRRPRCARAVGRPPLFCVRVGAVTVHRELALRLPRRRLRATCCARDPHRRVPPPSATSSTPPVRASGCAGRRSPPTRSLRLPPPRTHRGCAPRNSAASLNARPRARDRGCSAGGASALPGEVLAAARRRSSRTPTRADRRRRSSRATAQRPRCAAARLALRSRHAVSSWKRGAWAYSQLLASSSPPPARRVRARAVTAPRRPPTCSGALPRHRARRRRPPLTVRGLCASCRRATRCASLMMRSGRICEAV